MLGKVLIPTHTIEHIVGELAAQIDSWYFGKIQEENPLVIISVLKGSVIFTSDLIRKLQTPLVLDFLEVESYEGTQSKQTIKLTKGLSMPIVGKDVLVVEDIIDTGLTMKFLVNYLSAFNPKSFRICALLYKKENCKYPIKIDFLGTEVPNIFVVGNGLDYMGMYRNLTSIREWIT